MASAFLKGFGTGFFGGMAQQQEEARAENERKRLLMTKHYLENVIPQWQALKQQKGRMNKTIDTLTGTSFGYDRNVAIRAVQELGPDATIKEYIDLIEEKGLRPASKAAEDMQGILVEQGMPGAAPAMPAMPAIPTAPVAAGPTQPETITGLPPIPEAAGGGGTPDNFFTRVIMGRKSPEALHNEVVSDIAGMYGVSPEEVMSWTTAAYATDPTLELQGGPVQVTGLSKNDQKLWEKMVSQGFDNITDKDEMVEFAKIANQAAETGDLSILMNALPASVSKGEGGMFERNLGTLLANGVIDDNQADELRLAYANRQAFGIPTPSNYVAAMIDKISNGEAISDQEKKALIIALSMNTFAALMMGVDLQEIFNAPTLEEPTGETTTGSNEEDDFTSEADRIVGITKETDEDKPSTKYNKSRTKATVNLGE